MRGKRLAVRRKGKKPLGTARFRWEDNTYFSSAQTGSENVSAF